MAQEHGLATESMCKLGEGVKEKFKKFRFRKQENSAAIILKINKDEVVVIEDEIDDVTIEEVAEELPERSPRFVAYSYKKVHSDGRVSYPLCFILFSPAGCQPKQQMLFAGSRNHVVQTLGFTKIFEVRDKETITEEWLLDKLSIF